MMGVNPEKLTLGSVRPISGNASKGWQNMEFVGVGGEEASVT